MNVCYLLASGFYHAPGQREQASWFYRLWLRNLPTSPPCRKVVILANGGCAPPTVFQNGDPNIITLSGNLGHVHDLIGKSETPKPYLHCGWSATVLTLALIAYNDEQDFIYKEGDCLAFGPWIAQMYRELGDRKMIFGKSRHMPVAQSLFLIKHDFIPTFVRLYLSLPSDRHTNWLPEHKFEHLLRQLPEQVCVFSFGVDRDRPLPIGEPVWYAQKLTPAELHQIARAGLIDLPPNMPDVKVFSNDGLNVV